METVTYILIFGFICVFANFSRLLFLPLYEGEVIVYNIFIIIRVFLKYHCKYEIFKRIKKMDLKSFFQILIEPIHLSCGNFSNTSCKVLETERIKYG